MNIFSGAIGVIIGFLVIKYSIQITDGLGRMDFADKYFGSTTSFYRLAGVVIIFFSFLYMFGGIDVVVSPLGNFFGGSK